LPHFSRFNYFPNSQNHLNIVPHFVYGQEVAGISILLTANSSYDDTAVLPADAPRQSPINLQKQLSIKRQPKSANSLWFQQWRAYENRQNQMQKCHEM